jgi:steroid 5-alpha reductase family enzyme
MTLTSAEKKSAIAAPLIILLAYGLSLALASNSVPLGNGTLLGTMMAVAFVVQWLAFVPAYLLQTERFFDLTGSLTYIGIAILSYVLNPAADARALLVAVMVIFWAFRLGSFLFKRILTDGKDGRFDDIKPSFIRFFTVWTIQGLWVSLTSACALVVLTSSVNAPLGAFALIGSVLWLVGMTVEVIADQQKTAFKANPENKGKFIQTGLWAYSRHPNYAGEIILWLGVAIVAIPALQGSQWLALISPVFVYVLLNYVSGVPMLEKRSDDRWGGDDSYQAYKNRTRVLWPIAK